MAQRPERSSRGNEIAPEWLSVAPPTALDALVLERMQRVLAESRALAERERFAPGPSEPQALPAGERWVYALGLLAYGAQAVSGLARLLWHAVAG